MKISGIKAQDTTNRFDAKPFSDLERMIGVTAVPILPENAVEYQRILLDSLKTKYSKLQVNLDISLGGFITVGNIKNCIISGTGIKFHFCWDNVNLKLFAALEKFKFDIPTAANPPAITDKPGLGPYYISQNYFPRNRGNVTLMSFLPFTKNLTQIPRSSDEIAATHFTNIPLRENTDDSTATLEEIEKYKKDFRKDFYGDDMNKYTETYFATDELKKLIEPENCIGIRYYVGYSPSNGINNFRFILVAVDSSGNDILVYHDPAFKDDITKFVSTYRIIEKSYP